MAEGKKFVPGKGMVPISKAVLEKGGKKEAVSPKKSAVPPKKATPTKKNKLLK